MRSSDARARDAKRDAHKVFKRRAAGPRGSQRVTVRFTSFEAYREGIQLIFRERPSPRGTPLSLSLVAFSDVRRRARAGISSVPWNTCVSTISKSTLAFTKSRDFLDRLSLDAMLRDGLRVQVALLREVLSR